MPFFPRVPLPKVLRKPTTSQLSTHFTLAEFGCKCGNWPTCTPTRPAAALLAALENARAKFYRDGLVILSGVRDAAHNAAVGGAPKSQHVVGRAVDFKEPRMTIKQAIACGFTGIGVERHGSRWIVSHGDVRPLAKGADPIVWKYPSRGPVPRSEWT